ncbi:MAG: hypothetical protein WAV66_08755, partial [Anaerolineae bacterium]
FTFCGAQIGYTPTIELYHDAAGQSTLAVDETAFQHGGKSAVSTHKLSEADLKMIFHSVLTNL